MSPIKVAICLVVGIVLIVGGAVFTTPQYQTGEAFLDEVPIVFLVTDKYNAPIRVICEENDKGKATLVIAMNPEKQSEIKDCTVYLMISDPLASFEWKVTSSVQVKKLEMKSEMVFYSENVDVSAGTDSLLFCSFHLSREDKGITEINLQFDSSHQSMRQNGYYELRLPLMESHYGNNLITPEINSDSVQYIYPDAPDVYYATMFLDQKPLYAADAVMGFELIEESTFISSELSRDIVAPSAVYDRPTIYWEGQNRLAPYLRYEDRVWKEKRDARMILGGILIGLGGGLITAPVGNWLTKKAQNVQVHTRTGKKRK